MSVGWGLSFEDKMIIYNLEMEYYTYTDTIYISSSRLLPPCDDGYTEIDSSCYYQSDLDVLQIFIDNSDSTINMYMDVDDSGYIEPLELGEQEWMEGRLTKLDCNYSNNCRVSGEIPSDIGNLINLTHFIFGNNYLSGEIPHEIENLISLSFFEVWNNKIGCYEYDIENNICNIHCDETSVCSGEIPSEIGNLVNLFSLNLGLNQLTGEIPSELWDLNLYTLSLYSNQFSIMEIPTEICNMTILHNIWFQNSQLIGEIPGCIGDLGLNSLSFQDNQLTGEIPIEIGNLTDMRYFYLHGNQLTGEIPVEICNLNIGEMYNFQIQYNKFCPPYPECLTEEDIGYQDTSECVLTGDLTQDDEINVQDIIVLVDIVVEIFENDYIPTDEELQLGDIYPDGQLNVIDIVGLVNIILDI